MPNSITIRRPDDWHVHLRDGPMLQACAVHTARQFARAIIMPNLVPPVTKVVEAASYRERIRRAVPAELEFEPLMTCYLTDDADPAELLRGKQEGVWVAAKLYPAHATTNSAHGVTSMDRIARGLEAMEKAGMPLLVHGEVTDADVDIFDREAVFLDKVLAPLLKRHQGLKIVLEHITTKEGVAFVEASGPRVGGTITPHHLSYNRNAIFKGGIRPHLYCLPIAKSEEHRLALRRAATSGKRAILPRHRHRAAHRRHQGMRLRLRRHLQRTGGDAGLCPGLRRGGRARPAGGFRLAERPALLRAACQRGRASRCVRRPCRRPSASTFRAATRASLCFTPTRRSIGISDQTQVASASAGPRVRTVVTRAAIRVQAITVCRKVPVGPTPGSGLATP